MNAATIILMILMIATTSSVGIIWRYTKNKEGKDIPENVIKQPTTYVSILILAILGSVLLILFIPIASPETVKEDISSFIGLLIFIFSIIMVLTYFLLNTLNWKIELFKDHFIFTNFIGKKRIYQYSEIRLMDVDVGYRVYFGKRRIIEIPYMYDNWNKIAVYYGKHGKIEEWKKNKKS